MCTQCTGARTRTHMHARAHAHAPGTSSRHSIRRHHRRRRSREEEGLSRMRPRRPHAEVAAGSAQSKQGLSHAKALVHTGRRLQALRRVPRHVLLRGAASTPRIREVAHSPGGPAVRDSSPAPSLHRCESPDRRIRGRMGRAAGPDGRRDPCARAGLVVRATHPGALAAASTHPRPPACPYRSAQAPTPAARCRRSPRAAAARCCSGPPDTRRRGGPGTCRWARRALPRKGETCGNPWLSRAAPGPLRPPPLPPIRRGRSARFRACRCPSALPRRH